MADTPKRNETHGLTGHEHHEHRDPLTGTPGAHPIGTGIGAAGAGIFDLAHIARSKIGYCTVHAVDTIGWITVCILLCKAKLYL